MGIKVGERILQGCRTYPSTNSAFNEFGSPGFRASYIAGSNPAHKQQHDEHEQDDAKHAHSAVAIAIAVAAEAAADPAKQQHDDENDEYDSENGHGLSPVAFCFVRHHANNTVNR